MNNSSNIVENQTQPSPLPQYFTREELVAWCFGFGFLDALIIVSNTLAIVIFTRSKLLRKRTNYFLLCLSIADLMVGTISLPLFIHTLVVFVRGETSESLADISKISVLVDIFSGFASVFALTTVSLERFYSVALPSWHRTTPKYMYFILLASIWVLAGMLVCIKSFVFQKDVDHLVFNYLMIVVFLICLLVICLAYVGIWIKVVQRIHEKTKRTLEKDKRLATTLFLVTAIFVMTWVPFQGINMFYSELCPVFSTCPKVIFTAVYLTKFMQYTNSFVNPIIYTFKMPDFRRVLLSIFGRPPYGASTRATSRMITERRKRASTLRTSDSAEANGSCECAL